MRHALLAGLLPVIVACSGTDPTDPQKLRSLPVPEEVIAAFSRDQP